MIYELILSIVVSWLFVKIIKVVIDCSREKKVSLKALFYDGGMPSAHTASVVSLATGLFLETGLSVLFVMGVVFALVVINDALKVRWVTQEQSKALNKLVKEKRFDEHIGHKPVEVIVGIVLGIIIPIIIYALF